MDWKAAQKHGSTRAEIRYVRELDVDAGEFVVPGCIEIAMITDLEHMLWSQQLLPEAAWKEIALYLVSRLTDFLGQEVDLVDLELVDEGSFTGRIVSRSRIGGPLAIEWWGVLGMERVEGEPYVSATLFMYSMKQRLGIESPKGSAIEIVFERRSGGVAAWRSLGWVVDIYGEWNHVKPPWDIDEKAAKRDQDGE